MARTSKKSETYDAASECFKALDHLRNALDLTKPRSAAWYALFALIGKLAALIDTTERRPRS